MILSKKPLNPRSLIQPGCCPAIDRDGGALNMARAFGAEEQCHCSDVIWVTEAAQSLPRKHFGAQLFDRTAACRGAGPRRLTSRGAASA